MNINSKTCLLIPLLLLVLAVSAGPALAQKDKPAFPIPRAESEFTALVPGLQEYCDNVTKEDVKAFIVAATVYGPLDLQVTKAETPKEASYLKNFHLGVAGAASKMPSELMDRLGQGFQRGPDGMTTEKRRLVQELPQVQACLKQMDALPQITLLAHWGFKDEYRVNNTFHMMDQTNEALPSPVMGFIPSDRWKHYDTPQQYLDTIKVSKPAFEALRKAFEALMVAAIVRTDHSTQVIGLGIGNNQSGLMFCRDNSAKPVVGQRQAGGPTYVYVEQVKPNVYYYETG